MSSGIDLKIGESSNNSTNTKQSDLKQHQSNEATNPPAEDSGLPNGSHAALPSELANDIEFFKPSHGTPIVQNRNESNHNFKSNITPDLTRIAIQHLDRHQWQLPLMEMDPKFRDKTYYKHYSDYYITSLRSKLGHFLADKHMLSNPMRHHMQTELDNYKKYSKMFDLLTNHYQALGSNFFSFATPSPDEEIVIGCRLGTKGYYRPMLLVCCYDCCCSEIRRTKTT